ncbi:MAG: tetratricopeptide repeat protein [Candidatus Edwardsbacteria bacterium]|nr:tetratricopeptide repeat protein [Candidatus Edwardsbacteria bacterium]
MSRLIRAATVSLLILAALGCGDRRAVSKGREFLEMGDLSRALAQFEQAVSQNPRNASAHYLLARTYCLCDSAALAVKEYSLLGQLDREMADDTLLRQRISLYLGLEPYPSLRLTGAKGNDAFPCISGDGKRIAFSSKRDGNAELYIMSGDGGDQQRLTNHPAVDYGPSFSPDGSKLLFVSDREGNDEVYLYDLSAKKVTRLTYSKSDDWLPCFSPDGQEVFWVSDRSGRYAVWRMSLGAGHPEKENSSQVLFEDQTGEVAYFGLCSDRLIVQRESQNQSFLLSVDISDGRTAEIDVPSFRSGIPTIVLPDGESIAYVSVCDGNDEIYLYQPDQKRSLRLTNNASEDFVFGFTPDGKKMLYDSDRGGDRDVYLMQLDRLIARDQLLSKITKL